MVQTTNAAGCIALKGAFTKDRLRVLPNAERETDEKQSLFSRNRTENARARVGARYVKASGKQFYQKSDGREKEYRGDRHT